ncbi:hypothetical protein L873DRAFT_1831155 [Choiromyces venosus 120613-1]|uniref:Tc1-like transposase DDE domain-containing protein n=1 Tax=Choiromyces venosus 120613-1 TaxID=1336337 RepID=A0A3N4J5C4_9PEZI|nr:hypothetical protein L873DRAFT_1831155 [Choiromyces venosus 120613-1]
MPVATEISFSSTFNTNDGRHQSWHSKDQVHLRKKARGKGITLSDCAKGLDPQRRHATEFFEYGKNNEGYWKSEHLITHIVDIVIPMIELLYLPESYSTLFFFDNATSHACFTPDALQMKAMNLGPGGDQAYMRNTVFLDIQTGTFKAQSMVFSADHDKFPSQLKGLREVLAEHGLWQNRLRLDCKDKHNACCTRYLLDFHCELNWIEYYWGWAKHFTQDNCGYHIKVLRETIPQALESVGNDVIWKFYCKSLRIMKAYKMD